MTPISGTQGHLSAGQKRYFPNMQIICSIAKQIASKVKIFFQPNFSVHIYTINCVAAGYYKTKYPNYRFTHRCQIHSTYSAIDTSIKKSTASILLNNKNRPVRTPHHINIPVDNIHKHKQTKFVCFINQRFQVLWSSKTATWRKKIRNMVPSNKSI